MRRAVGLPDREGILVRAVEEDGPASSAGLEEGDLIVAVAGRSVASVDDLQDALAAAGTSAVELTLVRGTEERTVKVKPADKGDD